MNTATAPATLAKYGKLVRAAAIVEKRRREIVPRIEKLKARIEEAAEAGDATMIGVLSRALGAEINHITQALQDVNEARVFLDQVQEDDEFVADRLDAVAKLTAVVSGGQKALTRCFQLAKALENAAEKAAKDARGAPDDDFRELAWLDRNFEDNRKLVLEFTRRVEALRPKAEAAVEAGDTKALAQVQAALQGIDLAVLPTLNAAFVRMLKEFMERVAEAKYAEPVKAELQDGAQDLLKKADGTTGLIDANAKVARTIEALAIEAVDTKKALKVLGLDAKHAARLAKALDLPHAQREHALDAVARELKVAHPSGRQWLAELRKAGVVPR